MAGKTRMAAEVLREHFGDRPILLPSPPDGLSQLAAHGAQPEGTIVWLDDLDRFLASDGIKVEWLDRLRQRDNLIVATMRASEHARYQPDGQVRPPQAELLERFTVLRLDPEDDQERLSLSQQVDDPRLREGVARYGLAEYVGGGYLAVQRFENARAAPHPQGHPLGVAMVQAAVDWRRVGLDVIPANSLAALAPMYLPDRYRYDPGEDTATAKAWATEFVDATMRLLEPADDHGGTRAFDYILDYLGASSSSGMVEVPEHTWREAVATAPADRRMSLAFNAYESSQFTYAEKAWRQVADDQDRSTEAPQAAFNLGLFFTERGELGRAEAAYREAMHSGHVDVAPTAAVNLGVLLKDQAELKRAEAAFQEAMDSGHANAAAMAAFNLGVLFEEQDELERAEAAFREAVDSEDSKAAPPAAFNLGVLLQAQGDLQGAEAAYREVMKSGHADMGPTAAVNLGVLLKNRGDLDEAEAAYREAMESGHAEQAPTAAFNLGVLLKNRGDLDEAERVYRMAADSGDGDVAPAAAFNLGALLKEQGDLKRAEAAYREAMECGHAEQAPHAAVAVGMLLEERGEVEEAEAVYREVMESGHAGAAPAAAFNLGLLLEERGEVEEAAAVYREAMESGHADAAPPAAFNLGLLREERGELEQAEAAYREATKSGHADAANRAAVQLRVLRGESPV
ncbi:tetratricopeptide repeat protein [uncultured Pseudokineococcus sp.]|uniref:tetratricopeptide repeat protein n=1 Tax=uncultured Pseudokineococcus sp. TaxID=1642928 RepID=UPI002636A3EB|nr:tetratricopeptide repeat protein [uncultured Pseudokineococcus sp.]